MKIKILPVLINLGMACWFIPDLRAAEGLAMENYTEVLIENLQIGSQYSLMKIANLPLKIYNQGDEEKTISFAVLIPRKMKNGFEPIPDTRWIEVQPLQVKILARSTYETDVKIRIPDDPQWLGKKFQANIQAKILPTLKGMTVSLAVEGRLLFTIYKEKADVKPAKINLNYYFLPKDRVEFHDLPVGVKNVVSSYETKALELVNHGQDETQIHLKSVSPKEVVVKMEAGYEVCPDPSWLSFGKSDIVLPGGGKEPLEFIFNIPEEKKYRGKKYFFMAAANTDQEMSGGRFLYIYISTLEHP